MEWNIASARSRLLQGINLLPQDWNDRIGNFIDAYVGTAERGNVFCGRESDVDHVKAWIDREDAAPNLLFIPVAEGADRPAGPAEIVLDGWGFQDTHELLNTFTWGPDGWLYGTQGIFTNSNVGRPGASVPVRARSHASTLSCSSVVTVSPLTRTE